MKQIPEREEVIRAIDKAMSEESGCLENLEFAWFEIRRLEEIGRLPRIVQSSGRSL